MYLSYFLYFCTGNSIFELILANLMTNLRELINTKIARIMTDFLGHSNIFATLRRSPTREVTTPFILRAGRPRQYTAFLVFTQEKSDCFFVPVGRRRRGRRLTQETTI